MVRIFQKESLEEILNSPHRYVSEESDLALVEVFPTKSDKQYSVKIMIGYDPERLSYYIVEEDNESSIDIYPEDGKTIIDVFDESLKRVLEDGKAEDRANGEADKSNDVFSELQPVEEMRLVDANKLPVKFDGHTVGVWKNDLDSAPTVKAKILFSAHWEPRYDAAEDDDGFLHHRCSRCKHDAVSFPDMQEDFDENIDGEFESIGYRQMGIIEELTPFCPYCGAEMNEVVEEYEEADEE